MTRSAWQGLPPAILLPSRDLPHHPFGAEINDVVGLLYDLYALVLHELWHPPAKNNRLPRNYTHPQAECRKQIPRFTIPMNIDKSTATQLSSTTFY